MWVWRAIVALLIPARKSLQNCFRLMLQWAAGRDVFRSPLWIDRKILITEFASERIRLGSQTGNRFQKELCACEMLKRY
jgi:hypothetical protein